MITKLYSYLAMTMWMCIIDLNC